MIMNKEFNSNSKIKYSKFHHFSLQENVEEYSQIDQDTLQALVFQAVTTTQWNVCMRFKHLYVIPLESISCSKC